MSDLQYTPFYQSHLDSNGKIVDFSGFGLPIHYGSQIAEHEAVRNDAGMFDVSHMVVTDIVGNDAKSWLQKLLANDIAKAKSVGKAIYSAMLNDNGGVIDDLIAYRMNEAETQYRIVSNAATREKDLAQFHKVALAFGDVKITERPELAMLAVQGPKAVEKLTKAKPHWAEILNGLKPFVGKDLSEIEANDWFVAKTGYTGEDGVEVILPGSQANEFFALLKQHGVMPAGLGARDTLRLEAGMNLYGHEMNETINPYECGMAWTLAIKDDRDFVGRKAMQDKQAKAVAEGTDVMQVGLVLDGRGVLREGMEVTLANGKKGIITSGTFSPSLKQSIAIARIPTTTDTTAHVDMRGKATEVCIISLPFVRNGKKQFS
ncbi:glycine cleavage system aminomethyltransferase T [Moraxella macacae 0408225]|uniref:Aminomethyltransferase n=1 Tax=Moraxella macacae 0408225 TaxID=1230338 RepID=L2F6S8_9GAMM|nr:glycine cleavage system aminomethyltransferase GcvT [Moraxella macacae]ELA08143.1 glycine cleavage system aminomethyltransferase T [Moraxella macacae 0408225]